MELHINYGMSIKDLQLQFAGMYPNLQLKFATELSGNLVKAREKTKLNEGFELPETFKAIQLKLDEKTTVEELLSYFSKIGLTAQLFRKSGNLWIETSLTKDWTLERQNKEAQLIDNHL